MDYYKILGISKDATKNDIKKAYRKLAMQYHPDRNQGDKKAEEKFKEISEAYAVLSDDEKRKVFDTYGSADFQQRYSREDIFRGSDLGSILREFGINLGGGQGATFRTSGMGGFEDIFNSFGGMGGAQQDFRGGFSSQRPQPQKGSDQQLDLFITLEEVLAGAEKTIILGRGSDAEKVSVKVPPGIESGKKLRVSGKGSHSAMGGLKGDLYLLVKVQPHPVFSREGKDLVVDRLIRLSEALLGGEITVPTLGGKELKVKIPPGTQSHSKLRIKGKGVPEGPKGPRGNLFVRIIVDLPKKLSVEQEELVQDLAAQGL